MVFFFLGPEFEPGPYIYYALFIPTELSSRKLNFMVRTGAKISVRIDV